MPEIHFRIRLPDARELRCYSPSLVVEDYLLAGQSYALDDFMARCREALSIASERVRAKYGFACSAAMDQLSRLEAEAGHFRTDPAATVMVLGFER